jgi:hypothetical protein
MKRWPRIAARIASFVATLAFLFMPVSFIADDGFSTNSLRTMPPLGFSVLLISAFLAGIGATITAKIRMEGD